MNVSDIGYIGTYELYYRPAPSERLGGVPSLCKWMLGRALDQMVGVVCLLTDFDQAVPSCLVEAMWSVSDIVDSLPWSAPEKA